MRSVNNHAADTWLIWSIKATKAAPEGRMPGRTRELLTFGDFQIEGDVERILWSTLYDVYGLDICVCVPMGKAVFSLGLREEQPKPGSVGVPMSKPHLLELHSEEHGMHGMPSAWFLGGLIDGAK